MGCNFEDDWVIKISYFLIVVSFFIYMCIKVSKNDMFVYLCKFCLIEINYVIWNENYNVICVLYKIKYI